MAYDATDFVVTEVPAPVRDPKAITDPRERVAYLRDFLRELPSGRFHMAAAGDWSDAEVGHCGSAACIGGWARAVFGLRVSIDDIGEQLLGLSDSQVVNLFYPDGNRSNGLPAIDSRDARDAVAVLDHYLATGKIDWSAA